MKKEKKIQQTIKKDIFPYLNKHGGSIEVVFYDEIKQELQLRMIGQCCSCPHSVDTVENFVKTKLIETYPEIKTIHVNTGVSNELLEFAKQLLRKEK